MDIRSGVSNAQAVKVYGGGVGGSRVSMYQVAPEADLSLEDFEQYALDRLRVLVAIEENRSRGKRVEEVESAVIELWKKEMRTVQSDRQQQKDVISHFVLRLVHCRTERLRHWFVEMETALFRIRFKAESAGSQKAFIEEHKMPYKTISAAEFEVMKEKLAQVMRLNNQPASLVGETAFYKVPFEEVLELVATRKVYIHQGYAFVPREQLVTVVANHFRSILSQALVLTNRNWTAMFAAQEEDRLSPILEALSKRYLAPDYLKSASGSNVTLQELDGLAMRSFPLCMRHLYLKLQEDHHLRHGGRQQLGLFLKGIGLKLDDALVFWRRAFEPRMPAEKFDKEYAYNVRHNYGKEGKRTDYTPHSCMYIIMSTPGVGDHHGCPYRHFSPENLHAALSGMRLNPKSIDAVMEKTRARHYQLACAATFEGAHSCQCDGVNHPNQYFEQSQKFLKEEGEKATEMETGS